MSNEIKIGDVIQITHRMEGDCGRLTVGRFYIVKRVFAYSSAVAVTGDDGREAGVAGSQYQKAGRLMVGDRVIFVGDSPSLDLHGKTGIIRAVSFTSRPFYVEFPGRGIHWCHPAFLILANPAKRFIVITLEANGHLKPATTPFIHPTREEAEKEALRLTEVVGKTFVVFEQVASTKLEERQVTKTEKFAVLVIHLARAFAFLCNPTTGIKCT